MNANCVPVTALRLQPLAALIALAITLTFCKAAAQEATTSRPASDAAALTDTPDKDHARDAAGTRPRRVSQNPFTQMLRSSQLIGVSVRDPNTHRLGKIRDLLLDVHSGQVICALVEPRSAKNDLIVIPAVAFSGADRDRAVLRGTRKSLNDAPRFSGDSPDPSVMLKAVNDSYDYFNEKSRRTLSPGSHRFSKFSTLTERRITNPAGQDLGKASDLIIDLPAGRILFAVLLLDETRRNLYAVPPAALQTKPDGPELMLDLDLATVSSLAPYNDFFWADLGDPAKAARIYAMFGQSFETGAPLTNADSTRENVRARVEPAAAVDKGSVSKVDASDSEITQGILTAIVRDDVNHFPVRDIRVVTVNGHVTLSGRVENEGQRRKLVSFAAKLVGRGNVDDELQTR